jgi:HAE1 family hydrophobic/amphiphilic exporter-1
VAFSQVSSLLIALTIVPLLGAILFKKLSGNRVFGKTTKWTTFEGVKNFYRKLLKKSLNHRRWVLAGALGLFVLALAIIPFLGTEFMPSQDSNMILLRVRMPVGTSLAETNRVVSLVEKLMREQPEVRIISAQAGSRAEEDPSDSASGWGLAGSHEGILWVGLVLKNERTLSDTEVLEKIRRKLPRLEGVNFESVNMSQMFMGGSVTPVDIKIYGKDLDELKKYADEIVLKIKDVEGLRDVTHSLAQGKPEYHIHIDRERASRLGLMVSQVASTVQAATLGKVATRYREGSDEVDIRVRFQEKFRNTLDGVKNIPIVTPLNNVAYLDQVAYIEEGTGPIQITRENQSRRVSVTANIAGRDLGSVIRDVRKKMGNMEKLLPPGYFIEFGGSYEEMKKAFTVIAGAFALAVLLIYMVMASQFESFLHPFVIMFTIPLCLIGVVLGLLVTRTPISLPSLIGIVLLAGIAVNNGIVMIDYINQLKRRGIEKKEAIVEGATTRLRPVLLTALTTIIGMIPMAVSRSSGAEMRSPMAVSVLAGLLATTFLTLFVIPVIYSLFEKVKFKVKVK